MTLSVLFSDRDARWADWSQHLRAAFDVHGLDVDLHRRTDTPQEVDYVVYSPSSPLQDFSPFTRLKAVLSMWAGVETVVGNTTLTVPLTRMVDPGLTQGMVEYVAGNVLRYHLGLDRHVTNPDTTWLNQHVPPLAAARPIGILGLGALGTACGAALATLGFDVHGWSRSLKTHNRITCHAGPDGLDDILRTCQIFVLLLPDTPQTDNLLDAGKLARMPHGAFIINPGRGPLIVDADLIAALDAGRIAHATLDVFRTEPLPAGHAYWTHPRVTVTPHIAAETRPETAADLIAQNVRRAEAGEPLLHLVDRTAGY